MNRFIARRALIAGTIALVCASATAPFAQAQSPAAQAPTPSAATPSPATPSPAANWPAKPIRIIVPVATGGIADVSARLIGSRLTELWGQPVIVENKAGGG